MEKMLKAVEQIMEALKGLDGENKAKALNMAYASLNKHFPQDSEESIGKFYKKKNPITSLEKILVISYFLEKIEKKEIITEEDLRQAFKRAKQVFVSNFPRELAKAKDKKLILQDEPKKLVFSLSLDGEELVEQLPKEK